MSSTTFEQEEIGVPAFDCSCFVEFDVDPFEHAVIPLDKTRTVDRITIFFNC
ncbi:hypothetical protein [Brevibacillus laterosporus]|uniref:hypothetical protein n=1 Tax=Brevibacillus laterosporus TaxID=1465 RepID=UPI0018CE9EF3|nr:hypothetical protein [Brevibacillus laterosporus]